MQEVSKMKSDVGGMEPIIILIGLVVLLVGAAILWALGLVVWLGVGVLFAVGGLFLLQATPVRGWVGVMIGIIFVAFALILAAYEKLG